MVSGEFPDNSVIAGVPAKVIKTVDEYLEKAKKLLAFWTFVWERKRNRVKKIF